MRYLTLLIPLIVASGCASLPAPQTTNDALSASAPDCAAFFDDLEQRIADADALNAGARRIAGFPGFRVDRLLASVAGRDIDLPSERIALVRRLRQLDRLYRQHEIAQLSASNTASLVARSDDCGHEMEEAIIASPLMTSQLISAIEMPHHYVDSRRFGAYPLIRPFLRAGVTRWHEDARADFSNEPPQTTAVQYWPQQNANTDVHFPLQVDALGIPLLTPEQTTSLFAKHAPVFEISPASRDDRIGAPTIFDGRTGVDTKRPAVFEWLSYTRFAGAIRPQLNYIVWFPARTKTGPFDLYGGRYDGLNIRVTLDSDGAPLLFETIHNCGCYYKAYPTDRVIERSDIPFAEPPLILSTPDFDSAHSRWVFSMTPVAHYVNRVYVIAAPPTTAIRYTRQPYADLFSLSDGEASRSLFNAKGLVPGSNRLEGFLLWPSGVLAPGAMRQWGTHAIAFIGERHFDDPEMLDAMFQRSASQD